jgi:hypothetical protein
MYRICLSFFLLFFAVISFASNLQVKDVMLYSEGQGADAKLYSTFYLKWENGFRNKKNLDAVWVFLKFTRGNQGYKQAYVAKEGHSVIRDFINPKKSYQFSVVKDQLGFFLYPGAEYRGTNELRLKIALDPSKLEGFNPGSTGIEVFAIEMVYIPEGYHYIGEPDTLLARKYASFFKPASDGTHAGLLKIDGEKELNIGLDFKYIPGNQYHGDGKGILPEAYPKGFKGFFMMKYEITQGQYAAFLNTLSQGQSQLRVNFGGKEYYNKRGSIRFDGKKYTADFPDRPCNYISWQDAMAYADWSGLRPMTELEFSKACRGPRTPVAGEFPWGTNSKDKVERMVNKEGNLAMLYNTSEAELTDFNQEVFGASHFWVMDLAGSLWERVITVGDSTGRAFQGTHGDGKLSEYGLATNPDWPNQNDEKGGFGFAGGGFYDPDRGYTEFNPFSPVSFRPYGAWSGGNRTEAYGSRLVRSEF